MTNEEKPLLTSDELIKSMKKRGITFLKLAEDEAKEYILHKNNYFRTACYRKNFEYIIIDGEKKYIYLDFFNLVELSTLDMRYRYIIYQMCLDIEHALKVSLVKHFEIKLRNPYDCVKEFLEEKDYVKGNISRMRNKSYPNNLINRYFSFDDNKISDIKCPIWALVELLTFGDFLEFYFFCQDKYREYLHESKLLRNRSQIYLVKNLRNACAHNNCIFENLRSNQSIPPAFIRQEVSRFSNISKSSRQKRLTVRPILEFTSLLLIYKDLVSETIKQRRVGELKELFFIRMKKNSNEFKHNKLIIANYEFTIKIIDNIFFKED